MVNRQKKEEEKVKKNQILQQYILCMEMKSCVTNVYNIWLSKYIVYYYYNYNYVGREHMKQLETIKCVSKDCRNQFHHLCQNEYDNLKYEHGFEALSGTKQIA